MLSLVYVPKRLSSIYNIYASRVEFIQANEGTVLDVYYMRRDYTKAPTVTQNSIAVKNYCSSSGQVGGI